MFANVNNYLQKSARVKLKSHTGGSYFVGLNCSPGRRATEMLLISLREIKGVGVANHMRGFGNRVAILQKSAGFLHPHLGDILLDAYAVAALEHSEHIAPLEAEGRGYSRGRGALGVGSARDRAYRY